MGNPEDGVNYQGQLTAEVGTWCIEDDNERWEKLQRERIRHPKLVKDLLLDRLETHRMEIMEVGGGPHPVSELLPFKDLVVVDPCTEQYRKHFPCTWHIDLKIEDLNATDYRDLVICTNALDHVEDPWLAVQKMSNALRAGGYLAIMCAENNALTNPHPCHTINLSAPMLHDYLDEDFETVWELTFDRDGYRYGWAPYQGKRGQPAFALLLRKCVGY